MRRPGILLAIAIGCAAPGRAQPPPLVTGAEIAPAATTVVIGTITLVVDPLQWREGAYVSTYRAKVFPFFFMSEAGDFRITIPEVDSERLHRGHPIDFTGSATMSGGHVCRIEGHADAAGPFTGRVKVKVYLSRRIVIVFNSTYRLRVRS